MKKVGDRVPQATLYVLGAEGPQAVSTAELFRGKKVVLFAVPGAFTPTCSNAHLPGFVANADKIKGRGVDTIVCLSVNDAFVMGAWGKAHNAGALVMAADGNGAFTEAMGLTLDATAKGLGLRSQRYAMVVEDGVIKRLDVEAPGKFEVSSAERVLAAL